MLRAQRLTLRCPFASSALCSRCASSPCCLLQAEMLRAGRRSVMAARSAALCSVKTLRRGMASKPVPGFQYQNLFETTGHKDTPYKKLTSDFVRAAIESVLCSARFCRTQVSTVDVGGQKILKVEPQALRTLSGQVCCVAGAVIAMILSRSLSVQAFRDIAHLLRPKHLQQVSSISWSTV